MGRTFHYIQNDDVLKSFKEFKDSVLRERAVVIARHGDYSLFLLYLSDDELGLKLENTEKHKVIQERSYKVSETTDALVSRGVRHACQKMSELSDEDVNRKRLQIWKWYVLDWQKGCWKRVLCGLMMANRPMRRSWILRPISTVHT